MHHHLYPLIMIIGILGIGGAVSLIELAYSAGKRAGSNR